MVHKIAVLPALILSAATLGQAHAQTHAAHPYVGQGTVLATNDDADVAQKSKVGQVLDTALDAARKVNFRIGMDIHQETYTEHDGSGKVMQEKGMLYGMILGADIPVGAQGSVALEGLYATGDSDYTGSYAGGSYGDVKFKGQDRKLYKISATYKYRFKALGGAATGIGLDYRILTDKLEQAGSAGYRRKNTSTWAHLSIEQKLDLNNTWAITPQAKLSYLLKGTQTAEFGPGYKFKQDKGLGYELALDFTGNVKLFGYKQGVSIKPYYRFLEVKDSKVSNGWYEPRNKTKEIGVQIGMRF